MSHGFQFSRGLSTRITFKYRQVRLTTSPNPAVSLHPTHSDALSNASPLRASTYAGDDEVQSTRRRTRTTYELSEEDFSTRPKKKSRVALGQKGDSTSEIAYSSLQNRSLSPPIGQQTSSQELAPSLALSDTDLPSIRVLSEEKGVSSADASHSPPHDGLSTTNNSPTQSPSRSRTPTIESLRNQGLGTIESPWVVEDLGSPKAFDSIALNMQDIANNALNTSPAITEVMEAVSPNNEEISLSEFGGALLGRFGIQPERSLSCLPRAEALGLLDRIYVHLQNHSPGSEQYLQILRLLQECSLHCRALPTSFVVGGLNFDRQDIMGQGSEVTVYRGQLASQGVVVREIRMISGYDQEPARPKITQLVHCEAITCSQLHHPNILPFLGVYNEEVDAPPLLVLPFLERGSLRCLLAELRPGQLVNAPDLMCLLLGASRGVMYLHSQNPPVVHGRLHPGNILIDNSGCPLLSDFGFDPASHGLVSAAAPLQKGDKIRFLDPEAHISLRYTSSFSQESDIFGLAMIFLNVWSGQLPFSEIKDERKVELRYILGRRPTQPTVAVHLGPGVQDIFWELLVDMWTHDVGMRPPIGHVLDRLERIFDGSPGTTAFFGSFPVLSRSLTTRRPFAARKISMPRSDPNRISSSTSGQDVSDSTFNPSTSIPSLIIPDTYHLHKYDIIIMVSSWDLDIWIPVNIGSALTSKNIRKLIYTAVNVLNEDYALISLRRVYAISGGRSDVLSDYALLEVCLNMGDSKGTLKIHVSREGQPDLSTHPENAPSSEDQTIKSMASTPLPLSALRVNDRNEGPKTYPCADPSLRTAFPIRYPAAMTVSIYQVGAASFFSFERVLCSGIMLIGSSQVSTEYFALFGIDFGGRGVWASTRRSFEQNIAMDMVSVSKTKSDLWQPGQKLLMSCTYQPLQSLPLPQLTDILPLLNQGVLDKSPLPNPTLCKLDSWWYVVALLSALRPYRANWTTMPTARWAAKAVKTLSDPISRLLAETVARKTLPTPIYSSASISRCLLLSDWNAQPTSHKRSWLASELAVEQDAAHAVLRLLSEPYPDGIMMKEANQEHALELLQEALNDPSDKLGVSRPRALRMLQDLVSKSEKVPPSVKILAVRNRVFLDAGGEAVIWRVKLDASGEVVIAREARRPENGKWTSPEGRARLSLVRREIISQIHVQHPNILPILGISSDEKHPLSIITPFAQNGNAFQYLTGLAARDMSRKTIAMFKIMSQVASALEYLHNMDPQIIHGDLHGRNVLVDAKGNGLLSDFGLSRFKHEDTRTATNIVEGGKFRYIAPELFAPSLTQFRTTVQSDCYAFAMTILELATLERPFAEFDNERKAFTAAERGVRPQRAPLAKLGMQSEELADRLWTLLGDMWVQAHLKRPTMYTVNARLVDILCQTLSDR